MSDYILELNEVNKIKHKEQILSNINLKVKENQIIGILIPENFENEIFKPILKLSNISNGSIKFMGHNLHKEFQKCIKHIGFSSELIYKRNSTILDYLKLSNSFYDADYTENINYYINLFKLNPDKKLSDLNKYEKKIVSLINSIFTNPKLLLISEIDKDISSLYLAEIIQILNNLKNNQTSIIYTSKSLFLSEITDEIYLFKNNTLEFFQDKNTKFINIKGHLNEGKNIDLKDIYNLKITDTHISFLYKGKIQNLEKKISNINIEDLTITNPTLDYLEEKHE